MEQSTLRMLQDLLRTEVLRVQQTGAESRSSKAVLAKRVLTVFVSFLLGGAAAYAFLQSDARSGGSPEAPGIGIPAFVAEVRQELIASDEQRQLKNMPPLFAARSVDLEIQFVAKRTTAAGSKIALEVVDVDAKREISSEKTQKMTLHLDVSQPEQISIPPGLGEKRK